MHIFCSLSLFYLAALVTVLLHAPVADAVNQHVHSVVAPDECVVQAISLIPTDPDDVTFEHVDFMCEINSADDQGISKASSLSVDLSIEQKKVMIEKLENGELVSNVSTLTLDAIDSSINVDTGVIHVSPTVDVATILKKSEVGRIQSTTNIGNKHTLVVRVTDSKARVVPQCAAEVGDDIFGTRGDPVNLRTQMHLCSYGQVNFIAGDPPKKSAGKHEVTSGVIDVEIDLDLTQGTRTEVRNAITTKVQATLGFDLPGPYAHVLYVLEGCYKDCGWKGYGFVNGWLSVYQGEYYRQTRILMHVLGLNFNLGRSGEGNNVYRDFTCNMGSPLYSDDVGKMCFNGAKSWQLGWYDSNKHTFKASDGSWLGTIIGVADYDNNPFDRPVVVKLETGTPKDYFVTFNRATGINGDNVEADNMVTIVQTDANDGEGYSQSWLRAKLSVGKSYSIDDYAGTGKTLKVIVRDIVITRCSPHAKDNSSYAEVDICLDGNCAPTESPTNAPTTTPPSCVSGEAAVLTSASGSPHDSLTKVKNIKIGDMVRGFDSQMTPTSCKVEAIGSFGVGEVYGNYTADHYVFNPESGTVEQHGMTGPLSWEEKFDLIADCPLIEDEVGKRFAPIDSDFCGGSLKELSWSDYLLLHSAILNVVRESGAFWFQGSSYSDMAKVQQFAPRVCKNMVKCMKDNTSCKKLERVSQQFINNVLTKPAKMKARKSFSRIGSPCEVGSVSAVVTSGKTLDESLIGTAAC